jgi:hypothetical protein
MGCVSRDTLTKLSLHVDDMEFNAQDEELITVLITMRT